MIRWLPVAVASGLLFAGAAHAQSAVLYDFDIPAGDPFKGVMDFVRITGISVARQAPYDPRSSLLSDRPARAVRGRYTAIEALSILLAGYSVSVTYDRGSFLMAAARDVPGALHTEVEQVRARSSL